jgi:hypothetical protein
MTNKVTLDQAQQRLYLTFWSFSVVFEKSAYFGEIMRTDVTVIFVVPFWCATPERKKKTV